MTRFSFRPALAFGLVLGCGFAVAGCALFRPPPSPDDRIRETAQRFAEAPSDSVRRAVAVAALVAGGVAPIAGRRYEFGVVPVVAGFVPGRTPLYRDTLLIVAARLGDPVSAALVETARSLAATATRNEGPAQSLLFAFWSPERTDDEGLADVQAFPLWPARAVRQVILVAPESASQSGASARLSVVGAPTRPDAVFADSLAARLLRLAAVPRPADSLGVAPAGAPTDSL